MSVTDFVPRRTIPARRARKACFLWRSGPGLPRPGCHAKLRCLRPMEPSIRVPV